MRNIYIATVKHEGEFGIETTDVVIIASDLEEAEQIVEDKMNGLIERIILNDQWSLLESEEDTTEPNYYIVDFVYEPAPDPEAPKTFFLVKASRISTAEKAGSDLFKENYLGFKTIDTCPYEVYGL
jgi:hypothetical protein